MYYVCMRSLHSGSVSPQSSESSCLGFFKIQPVLCPLVFYLLGATWKFLHNLHIAVSIRGYPCPDVPDTPLDFWVIMCFGKSLLHCQAFWYVLNGLALLILPWGSWGSWTIRNCWQLWPAKISGFQPSLPRLWDILCWECEFEAS